MSMVRALALLGTGAESFVEGQNDAADQARKRSAEAFAENQRQFQIGQQQRLTDQQAADAAAAAPISAQPAPSPDQPVTVDDDGNALPPVGPMVTVAGGQPIPAAQGPAAVAAANSPEAIQARQIASRQATDPAAAAAMTNSVQQAQLAKIKVANDLFDNDLNKAASAVTAGNWGPLEDALKQSGASGPFSAKFVPSADGKTVEATIVHPDGSTIPTGKTYPNTPEGAQEAAAFLSRSTPIEAKVAHAVQAKQLAEKQAHDIATENATTAHTAVMDKYYQGLIDTKFDANDVRAGANASKLSKMPEEDKATLADYNKQLELINSERVKAQAGGLWTPDSPGENAMKVKERTLLMQRQALLAPYLEKRGTDTPDPAGLRPGGGGTSTTRAPTPAEIVAQDMKANNVTNATSEIRNPDGSVSTTKFGTGATPGPMAAAASKAAESEPIPDAPPQKRQIGIRQVDNPDYTAWLKTYGDRFAADQKRRSDEADAAALAAKKTFDPYRQNAVR